MAHLAGGGEESVSARAGGRKAGGWANCPLIVLVVILDLDSYVWAKESLAHVFVEVEPEKLTN